MRCSLVALALLFAGCRADEIADLERTAALIEAERDTYRLFAREPGDVSAELAFVARERESLRAEGMDLDVDEAIADLEAQLPEVTVQRATGEFAMVLAVTATGTAPQAVAHLKNLAAVRPRYRVRSLKVQSLTGKWTCEIVVGKRREPAPAAVRTPLALPPSSRLARNKETELRMRIAAANDEISALEEMAAPGIELQEARAALQAARAILESTRLRTAAVEELANYAARVFAGADPVLSEGRIDFLLERVEGKSRPGHSASEVEGHIGPNWVVRDAAETGLGVKAVIGPFSPR